MRIATPFLLVFVSCAHSKLGAPDTDLARAASKRLGCPQSELKAESLSMDAPRYLVSGCGRDDVFVEICAHESCLYYSYGEAVERISANSECRKEDITYFASGPRRLSVRGCGQAWNLLATETGWETHSHYAIPED